MSALNLAVSQNLITFEQLAQDVPTFIVHAYYDTGVRNTASGVSRPVLRPLTSFGYFVVHDGDVAGWNYQLQGAQLIAPNWYKVAVPASGLAQITTVIEAIKAQPFSVGLRAGLGVPHGAFGNQWDPGFSFDADLEYAFNGTVAVQGVFGYNGFGSSGSSDLKVTRLSVNPKAYFGTPTTRGFFNAGVGVYWFDPGTKEFGTNVGAGVQRHFTTRLALEAAYNFHVVTATGTNATFSTFEAGLRFRV